MAALISQINLVIECRDYRVPLTSQNPLFEQSLAGRDRIIVYTKRDLGSNGTIEDFRTEDTIRSWHSPATVLFTDHKENENIRQLLDKTWSYSQNHMSLTGLRMMVVGMPNVGKSSLLNALRKEGVGKGKAARTGAQPGITRKIASSVKIIDGTEKSEGVYLLDTPGVFVPYVPDAEAMLKLALCGNVKDTIVQPTLLVDYLLFKMNLRDPQLYGEYCSATNDATRLITSVAESTGRLQKGGIPDTEAAALWIIQRWRNGRLGRFMLDDITREAFHYLTSQQLHSTSLSQARKAQKEVRRAKTRSRISSSGS